MALSEGINKRASSILSEVMEDVGVNTELIMKRRNMNLTLEQMYDMRLGIEFYCFQYLFGSQSEGSTITELYADDDMLTYEGNKYVAQTENDIQLGLVNLYLIQNSKTHPGYCWLKLRYPDHADSQGRYLTDLFCDHYADNWTECNGSLYFGSQGAIDEKAATFSTDRGPSPKIHGPAVRIGNGDIVATFKCTSWPTESLDWFEKDRPTAWPSKTVLEEAKDDGCLIAPVGHPESDARYKKLQWRISYSLTERRLMFSLNITQMQCYVLMKILKESFLKGPDSMRGLTSYHLKTALFHTIESEPHLKWEKEDLMNCLAECFITLKNMLEKNNCPHFTNPRVDLFVGKVSRAESKVLCKTIDCILHNVCESISRIRLGRIGTMFRAKYLANVLQSPAQNKPREQILIAEFLIKDKLEYMKHIAVYDNIVVLHRRRLEPKILVHSISMCIAKILYNMMNGNRFQVSAAMIILPGILGFYASLVEVISGLGGPEISEFALTYLNFAKIHDKLNVSLKLASIYYTKGNIIKTVEILAEMKFRFVLNTCKFRLADIKSERFEECLRFLRQESKWCFSCSTLLS